MRLPDAVRDEQDTASGLCAGLPDQRLCGKRGFHIHDGSRLVQNQEIIGPHQDAAQRRLGRLTLHGLPRTGLRRLSVGSGLCRVL